MTRAGQRRELVPNSAALSAEPAARSGMPPARSGDRGKPAADLLARIEQEYPGIEEKIGLSSAALRAGQAVRRMRKSMGWTQTQLADALGWEQERISNIERGEGSRGPTYDVLQRIATACHYNLQFRQLATHPLAATDPAGGGRAEAVPAAIGDSFANES